MVTIRAAAARDHRSVRALDEQIRAQHAAALPSMFHPGGTSILDRRFAMLVRSPYATVLLAEEDHAVLGFAVVRLLPPATVEKILMHLPVLVPALDRSVRLVLERLSRTSQPGLLLRRRVAFVDSLVVGDAWRRRGIGTALHHACVDWARAHRADELELDVYEFNRAAITLYERLGLETFCRRMRQSIRPCDGVDGPR